MIKYLGIQIDANLNWKSQINNVSKKISRSIGLLSKIRYFVLPNILIMLYYALVYPYLIYGVIVWGNTYQTNIKKVIILQKKAIRIITFSPFSEHTNPLFKQLNLLKFTDIVNLHTALFMYQYHSKKLPKVFDNFFHPTSKTHQHNTRHAAKNSYYLPKIRTNYGKFNIRFTGPKVWNEIPNNIKSQSTFKSQFKFNLISFLITSY